MRQILLFFTLFMCSCTTLHSNESIHLLRQRRSGEPENLFPDDMFYYYECGIRTQEDISKYLEMTDSLKEYIKKLPIESIESKELYNSRIEEYLNNLDFLSDNYKDYLGVWVLQNVIDETIINSATAYIFIKNGELYFKIPDYIVSKIYFNEEGIPQSFWEFYFFLVEYRLIDGNLCLYFLEENL